MKFNEHFKQLKSSFFVSEHLGVIFHVQNVHHSPAHTQGSRHSLGTQESCAVEKVENYWVV